MKTKLPMDANLNYFFYEKIGKIVNSLKLKIEANASMTRVILIGSAGSGKSCIMNSLLKKPLKICKSFGDFFLKGEGVINSSMAADIEPDIYVDESSQMIFCEYKGTFDYDESYFQEILNYFMLDKLLQKINGHDSMIKILFVCSRDETERVRVREFFQLIEYMKKIFCNFDELKDRIGLIITETDPSLDASHYIGCLHRFSKNQNLFNDLQNVFLYPRPQKCDFGKNYIFNDYERLVRFIHTDPIVNPQTNIILSKKALLATIEFRKVYTDLIMQAVNKLCTKIKSNLASVTKLREISNLINSIKQIITDQIRDTKDVERILRETFPNSDQYNDEFTMLDSFNPFDSFLNKVLKSLANQIFDPEEVTKLLRDFIDSWKDKVLIDLLEKMNKADEK